VICQSLTFAASANPIVYLGAQPVFVDSESETWNICPHLLEEIILDRISKGKLPKAIVTVNLFGMPAKMQEIILVANRYGIPVLEDAAESLGAKINNRYCGTFGDIGIFSFNGNKIITTGGGGALVTANNKWAKNARHLATQAKDDCPHYEHSAIGYNYRMNNIAAGIGLAQLGCLEERIVQRRRIFRYYQNALKNMPGISFLQELPGYFSNRWLTTLLIDPVDAGFDQDTLRIFLENHNIESKPIWKPMHLQPVYSQAPYYGGGIAEGLFAKGLCLPSSSNLTIQEMDRVIECLMLLHQGVYK
jgi:dTDP-4-amino-4,6-dideoxygalactose transaminase